MSKSIDAIFAKSFSQKNIDYVYHKLGNKTSKGIDKIGFYTFEKSKTEIFRLINSKTLAGTYKFSPYLENLKLKGRNKLPRVISIATIRDRIVLSILKDILHEVFHENVNKKLPNKYIADIKKYIKKKSDVHFFQTDIEKFYDKIDRKLLFDMFETKIKNKILLDLLKGAINNITIPSNSSLSDREIYITKSGVPQGLAISNISAHIYLKDFDSMMTKRNLLYLRYVDDILILTDKPFSNFRIDNVKTHLKSKNLCIHDDGKTFSGKLTNNINYLGYKINDTLISISDKNIQTFISSITGLFTHYKRGYFEKSRRPKWLIDDDKTFNSVFIENLNERITGSKNQNKNYGWLFFFSEITDKNLLFRIDKIIQNFFFSLDSFGKKSPKTLKRLVRTFYEIKHNPSSTYINNYNIHDTPEKKLKYLIFRGYLDPAIKYSISEIDTHYDHFKKNQLRKLEKDIGYSYF